MFVIWMEGKTVEGYYHHTNEYGEPFMCDNIYEARKFPTQSSAENKAEDIRTYPRSRYVEVIEV